MRWEGRQGSDNVVVRGGGGGGGGLPIVGGGAGLLVVLLIAALTGFNPGSLLSGGPETPSVTSPEMQKQIEFVKVVLKDTEDVWHEQFRRLGKTYEEPKLVIFQNQVSSACGNASSAVGPFYCPEDRTVYLDLSFFQELSRRFGAPGDFACAYVIAHEVGHHVQTLLGTSRKVHAAQQRGDRTEANALSVRLELQADFFAGVWAHHAQASKNILEPGDLEEALGAATAIGDDKLQRESRGRVVPDSFTHGTSAQRVAWFRRGWESGDLAKGDTFDDATYQSVK